MEKEIFALSDISDELIQYIDKYLKVVIMNTKRRYCKTQQNCKKHGIIIVDLDSVSPEEMSADDSGYEDALCQYIEVNKTKIPVYNPTLADALQQLTDSQRNVLLQNIVLKIPMRQIAQELKISQRMAEKHKHNAIEAIKRSMKYDGF